MNRNQPRSNAFTLVELLVVIGAIGILVAILLPSLAAARNAAKGVQCMSNLRQIGIGVITYTSDCKGQIPYIQSWNPYTIYTNNNPPALDERPLLLNLVNDYHVFYCPFNYNTLNPDDLGGDGWNGAITGASAQQLLQCSYDLPGLWIYTPFQKANLQSAAISTGYTSLPTVKLGNNRPTKLGGFDPEQIAIATDSQRFYNAGAADSSFTYPGFTGTPSWIPVSGTDFSFPHRRGDGSWDGTTTVFFDGHAEYKKREQLKIGNSYPWNAPWIEWAGWWPTTSGAAQPEFW
jgi:prepilin-type N-terminal cleavage/methylation domain-containing protein